MTQKCVLVVFFIILLHATSTNTQRTSTDTAAPAGAEAKSRWLAMPPETEVYTPSCGSKQKKICHTCTVHTNTRGSR
jgi:hypothetical protein